MFMFNNWVWNELFCFTIKRFSIGSKSFNSHLILFPDESLIIIIAKIDLKKLWVESIAYFYRLLFFLLMFTKAWKIHLHTSRNFLDFWLITVNSFVITLDFVQF